MRELSAKHDVPLWLAVRMVQVENCDWNPRSVSARNTDGSRDFGLMQHNSLNFKKFSDWYTHSRVYDPLSAWDNVDVGLAHLAWLHSEFGDWTKAVMAYNTGESRVWKGTVKPQTVAYAKAVLGARYGIKDKLWQGRP
jgi:soluble lytic murein transglycosylase-like protein